MPKKKLMKLIERLRATARRAGARAVSRRVLIIIACASAGYLALANALLLFKPIRGLVSQGPDSELSYEAAYSLWPGRVHFEDLELVIQDYNVQFAVRAQAGSVDVSLHELFFKRFHAVAVTLEGLSFRFRHKLSAVGGGRGRVAAYPPITGYSDPPLYDGPKPSPGPGQQGEAWAVELEHIRAELAEIWVQEYRYLGGGAIEGGFELAPGRGFEVFSSRVKLAGGELTVGGHVVAERVALQVVGGVEHTPTDRPALAMLESASGALELDSSSVDTSTLNIFLGPQQPLRVAGRADLELELRVSKGRLSPESRGGLRLRDMTVSAPYGRVSGTAAVDLALLTDDTLQIVATSPELRLDNDSGHKAPSLKEPSLLLRLGPIHPASPVHLRQATLELPQVDVPSLGWLNPLLPQDGAPLRVGGRLEGSASFGLSPPSGPRVSVRSRLVGGEIEQAALRAALSGHLEVELEPQSADNSTSEGRVDVELDGVRVAAVEGERGEPFRLALRAHDVRMGLHPEPRVSGTVGARAAPADSLLGLVLGSSLLEDLAASVLDLDRLEATAQLDIDRRSTRLELSRAESGVLEGRGFWRSSSQGPSRGAFLVQSELANVGLVLRGSDTRTDLFVADDWLSRRDAGDSKRPPD